MPQKILDGFLFLRFANVVLGTFFPPIMFPKSLSEAPVRSQKAHLGRLNTSILVEFRGCLVVQRNIGIYNININDNNHDNDNVAGRTLGTCAVSDR